MIVARLKGASVSQATPTAHADALLMIVLTADCNATKGRWQKAAKTISKFQIETFTLTFTAVCCKTHTHTLARTNR